jgi:hypothetical protein
MKRRKILEMLAATASSFLTQVVTARGLGLPNIATSISLGVKRVLTVFKCHFDAGFIDTQAMVARRYFEEHFPRAISITDTLHQQGSSATFGPRAHGCSMNTLNKPILISASAWKMRSSPATLPGTLFHLVGRQR